MNKHPLTYPKLGDEFGTFKVISDEFDFAPLSRKAKSRAAKSWYYRLLVYVSCVKCNEKRWIHYSQRNRLTCKCQHKSSIRGRPFSTVVYNGETLTLTKACELATIGKSSVTKRCYGKYYSLQESFDYFLNKRRRQESLYSQSENSILELHKQMVSSPDASPT
jgi:hypothetical protein